MRHHLSIRGSLPSSGLLFIGLVSLLGMSAAACSSSNPTPTTTAPTTLAVTPTGGAPASSASTTDLSGTWSGQYSGAYQGKFTLTWQQSGSKLSGTIKLPSLGQSPSIHGTVQGSTISFGTVGSTAIQYSGTVSGTSMSGNYEVQTSTGSAGGAWSADKDS